MPEEQEDHDMILKLYTEIVGLDGNPGLAETVRQLACRHNKLSRNFWMLVGILTGSGVIGAGINYFGGI